MKTMDFDIGNILYVVITLVAIIIGLLGRKKKSTSPASKSRDAAEGARPGFMESLEQFLRNGEEPPGVVDLKENEQDLPVEAGLAEERTSYINKELQDEASVEEGVMRQAGVEDDRMTFSIDDSFSELYTGTDTGSSDPAAGEEERSTPPLEVLLLDQEEGADYFEIIRNFDAGTAVVYSAIINRIDF